MTEMKLVLGSAVITVLLLVAIQSGRGASINGPVKVTYNINMTCLIEEKWCYKAFISTKTHLGSKVVSHPHACANTRSTIQKLDMTFTKLREFWDKPAKMELFVLHNCTYYYKRMALHRELDYVEKDVSNTDITLHEQVTFRGKLLNRTFAWADRHFASKHQKDNSRDATVLPNQCPH